jgi:type IV pilus biogenesis protein CpaD/CtpE
MKAIITALAFLALAGCASNDNTTTTTKTTKIVPERIERTATVERYLTNSMGEADGLLLTDGLQVMVPSRFSKELIAIAPPKSEILILGPIENGKTIQAEKITNKTTGQSISDIRPMQPVESQQVAEANATTQVQEAQDRVHKNQRKQKKLSARGTVRNQLYGHQGEVNGVILSDGSIVRFAPKMIDESDVKIDIGEKIQASGYGTKNVNGQSIEATSIKN